MNNTNMINIPYIYVLVETCKSDSFNKFRSLALKINIDNNLSTPKLNTFYEFTFSKYNMFHHDHICEKRFIVVL